MASFFCFDCWFGSRHVLRMHGCREADRVAYHRACYGEDAPPRTDDSPCGGVEVPACPRCWASLSQTARLAILAGVVTSRGWAGEAYSPVNLAAAVVTEPRIV